MRVGIGPTNAGGQAYRLAVALRSAGIDAESFGLDTQHKPPLKFPVDRVLTRQEWGKPAWQAYVRGFTHLLMWNGVSPYGPHRWWDHELHLAQRMAVVFRGSELRYPTKHQRLERWSPFAPGDDLTRALTVRNDRLRERLRLHPPKAFVATLEMLDYIASATWMPIIADPVEAGPVLERDRPVVLHIPTNGQLKGAKYVEAVSGIELRRPEMMWPDQALAAIRDADVVIGGLVLGDYGGTEIQALAAGRLVVGNVSQRVRRRLDVPIVQAEPNTLSDVLRDIVNRREFYRAIAAQGPAFHARYHDGRRSVAALADFLGLAEVAA